MLEVKLFSRRDPRFIALAQRDEALDFAREIEAAAVIREIRSGGLEALLARVRRSDFPHADPDTLRVSAEEMERARREAPTRLATALSLARVNLRKFHEHQRRGGYAHHDGDGVWLSRRVHPHARVGICCRDSLSALLMCSVPAQVAGVGEIVCALAPRADGTVDPHCLAAAHILGINEVYRMSGAHAAAALALGVDDRIRRVDALVGPGGPEAEAAKRLLAGRVRVNLSTDLAELVVVADASANARFIAADFLAQLGSEAEQGALALFSTDRALAEAVRIELDRMAEDLPSPATVRAELKRRGGIFVCRTLTEALDAANALAPARLALLTRDDSAALADVEYAGAVFLGPWSGQATGDAFAGINQILPAAGMARFASGLGVDDFVREMTIMEYSATRLAKTGCHMALMAEAEGGGTRADAIRERMDVLKLV